jgi:hypothetical protein
MKEYGMCKGIYINTSTSPPVNIPAAPHRSHLVRQSMGVRRQQRQSTYQGQCPHGLRNLTNYRARVLFHRGKLNWLWREKNSL